MHVVKPLGLRPRQVQHLGAANAEAFLLKAVDDQSSITGLDSVWF
jgi:hypothetical protein